MTSQLRMNRTASILIVAAAALVLSCGKKETSTRPDINEQPSVLVGLADPKGKEAETLLDAMIAAERAFDPATAVFYADDGHVLVHWTSADGQTTDQKIAGLQYKRVLNATLASEKETGRRARYSDFKAEVEERGVRVRGQRYDDAQHTTTPVSWLVARDYRSRTWRIVEQESTKFGVPVDLKSLDAAYQAPTPEVPTPSPNYFPDKETVRTPRPAWTPPRTRTPRPAWTPPADPNY